MSSEFDVTVFITTYNSDLDKILLTLKSILLQKNVSYEIIIGDDASEKFSEKAICDFFECNKFYEYKILRNQSNQGTVKNVYNISIHARGKYLRGLGPGDIFYDEFSLYRLVRFATEVDAGVVFSDVIYYSYNDDCVMIHDVLHQPNVITIYDKEFNGYAQKVNYILFGDRANGASFFYSTKIFSKYLEIIVDRIIYEEDYVFFFMVGDDIKLHYYKFPTVCYEYGTGISTANNSKWNKLLAKDDIEGESLLLDRYGDQDKFWKMYRYIKKLRDNEKNGVVRKIKVCLHYPSLIYWYFYRKFNKVTAIKSFNYDFFEKLKKEGPIDGV